jgi:hypothetical protein
MVAKSQFVAQLAEEAEIQKTTVTLLEKLVSLAAKRF